MGIRSGGLPDGHEVADLFGYVTDEDRARWERARERRAKPMGSARQMAQASIQAAHGLAQKGIDAKINGEQYTTSQQIREQSQSKKTRTTITETVTDFEDRDNRTPIEDLDLGL